MSDGRRDVRGLVAEKPTEIPATGWWQVIRRAWAEAKADQVPLLAAGVAFFGFLSLFPAVVAAVLAYGVVADPSQIRNQVKDLAAAMPASGRDLLLQQLDALTSAPRQGLGIGARRHLPARPGSGRATHPLGIDRRRRRHRPDRAGLRFGCLIGWIPAA